MSLQQQCEKQQYHGPLMTMTPEPLRSVMLK